MSMGTHKGKETAAKAMSFLPQLLHDAVNTSKSHLKFVGLGLDFKMSFTSAR